MNTAVSGNRSNSGTPISGGPTGVLLIDKPTGITSHDVVDVLRRVYGIRAIGHTGTLDPAASGLMIMLLGRATKIAPFVSGLDKCYQAGIYLGKTSDTGDAEGDLSDSGDPSSITDDMVVSVLKKLQGEIALKIPPFAAVHTEGKRRYELARSGKTPPPLARNAQIESAELVAFANPMLTIRVRCSAGTYIRSYAEAVGDALGCGAYLASLHREEIGQWHIRDAVSLRQLTHDNRGEDPLNRLLSLEEFLPWARVHVTDEAILMIANGRSITPEMICKVEGTFVSGDSVLICAPKLGAIAITTAKCDSQSCSEGDTTSDLFAYQRVLMS